MDRLTAVVFTGLVWTIMITSPYWIVKRMPTSTWFTYHGIEVCQSEFALNEHPSFVSKTSVSKETNFRWRDILYCDFGNGMESYSQYPSGKDGVTPHHQRSNKWHYQGPIPGMESKCYLESQISHQTWLGINTKPQIIVSDFFQFVK